MSDRLPEIQAWLHARGFDLLLSETRPAGKAYGHVFGGTPRTLRTIIVGDSLLDVAEQTKEAVQSRSVLPAPTSFPGSTRSAVDESLTMDMAILAGTKLVYPDPGEKGVKPQPELLETHVRILKWQRQDARDNLWLVQAYDEAENLLAMGLGDDPQDAYLELSDKLMPPADR